MQHIFLLFTLMIKSFLQPCVSQRAGGEVDVCCRDSNTRLEKGFDHQSEKEKNVLHLNYCE
jgi:hypothetical protein